MGKDRFEIYKEQFQVFITNALMTLYNELIAKGYESAVAKQKCISMLSDSIDSFVCENNSAELKVIISPLFRHIVNLCDACLNDLDNSLQDYEERVTYFNNLKEVFSNNLF